MAKLDPHLNGVKVSANQVRLPSNYSCPSTWCSRGCALPMPVSPVKEPAYPVASVCGSTTSTSTCSFRPRCRSIPISRSSRSLSSSISISGIIVPNPAPYYIIGAIAPGWGHFCSHMSDQNDPTRHLLLGEWGWVTFAVI